MEATAIFTEKMEQALGQKCQELEKQVLPRLRENFSIYHKSLQTIINVLTKKSLIQEDPYKYEQKISEVSVPDTRPFAESEKQMQMSIRLSNYESQLEFLNQYYQFSIDFLDMKKLKTLAALVNYIKWDKANAVSGEAMSTHFYELISKIQADSDPMSYQVLSSSRQDLINRTKQILKDLKELGAYHKEAYKQKIRTKILPALGLSDQQMESQQEKTLLLTKKKFSQLFPGEPLYGDLFLEVVKEFFSPQRESLQNDLLKQYAIKPDQTKQKKAEQSYKSILLDGAKLLGGAGALLEQALGRLNSNLTILENRKKSLGEKLKLWLSGMSKDKARQIMEIEVFEEENGISKTIKLDYNAFKEKTLRFAKLLGAMTMEVSPVFQKLSGLPEEELYKNLSDKTTELQKTCSFLPALEVYLRSEAPREQRGKLFGVDKELEAIKVQIQKANQKRFEYATRVEEQEQLKRLGIS